MYLGLFTLELNGQILLVTSCKYPIHLRIKESLLYMKFLTAWVVQRKVLVAHTSTRIKIFSNQIRKQKT